VYGTDASDIESWEGLCTALNVKPLPGTLEEATKVCHSCTSTGVGGSRRLTSSPSQILKGKFVNLVDLVDRHNSGGEVIQFTTLQELQDYTIANGKFFPKGSAYAGGVLKFLLREILG
jgi:hypothetical protein